MANAPPPVLVPPFPLRPLGCLRSNSLKTNRAPGAVGPRDASRRFAGGVVLVRAWVLFPCSFVSFFCSDFLLRSSLLSSARCWPAELCFTINRTKPIRRECPHELDDSYGLERRRQSR